MRDYIFGMLKILQYKKPEDFILATGKTYSVRNFVENAFHVVGIDLIWKGSGLKEKGINKDTLFSY